jgi:hypothetical protein
MCQVFTVVGAVTVAVSSLPAAGVFQSVLFWVGMPGLLAAIWLPYATRVKAIERVYRPAADGLEWEAEEYGAGRAAWPTFRGAKHVAGALVLRQQPGCPPIIIPLRVFGPEQLADFERAVNAGLSSGARHGGVLPLDAGEPIFSFQSAPPRFWRFVRIRAAEIGVALPMGLGIACLLAAFALAIGGESAWAICYGVLATLAISAPWTLATLVTAAGRRALRPFEIHVYPAGYRVVGAFESWTPWSAFGKAQETPDGLVLFPGRSRRHVHLWTAGLTEADQALLHSVLGEAHLSPVQAAEEA